MGFKDFFKPRQDNFLRLLNEQSAKTLEGLEALLDYMTAQNDDTSKRAEKAEKDAAKRVEKAEKEADELRRILIEELNRTFVTPIDREDIFDLSRAVDDILDYAYSTVDEMQLLEVRSNDYLRRMVSLLRDAVNEISLAMQRLKDHPGVANEHARRAKALENQVESVYREGVAELFRGPKNLDHVVEMLKLREIYRHLSNAADRGDEAANIIADVVVKMT
jgi:uncharacterized protein